MEWISNIERKVLFLIQILIHSNRKLVLLKNSDFIVIGHPYLFLKKLLWPMRTNIMRPLFFRDILAASFEYPGTSSIIPLAEKLKRNKGTTDQVIDYLGFRSLNPSSKISLASPNHPMNQNIFYSQYGLVFRMCSCKFLLPHYSSFMCRRDMSVLGIKLKEGK